MAEAKNEVALVKASDFPFLANIVSNPDVDLPTILEENLGGEDFSPFDLERIVLPGSGGTIWEVSTIDGPKNVDKIRGIVLSVQRARAYWESEMDGEGTPPDCSSNDGVHGFGNPGGECITCPLNQFGSGKNNGKACKEIKNIFLLTENSMLPVILQVPPTSLKIWKKYAVQLMGHNFRSIHGVVTEFTLEKCKAKSGFTHSRLVLKCKEDLTDEQKASVIKFRNGIEQALASQPNENIPTGTYGDDNPAGMYEEAPQFD
jgi:hypothetical protein